MADRRAELEKKRQRLAQLQAEKERRQREKEAALLEVNFGFYSVYYLTLHRYSGLILYFILIFYIITLSFLYSASWIKCSIIGEKHRRLEKRS